MLYLEASDIIYSDVIDSFISEYKPWILASWRKRSWTVRFTPITARRKNESRSMNKFSARRFTPDGIKVDFKNENFYSTPLHIQYPKKNTCVYEKPPFHNYFGQIV